MTDIIKLQNGQEHMRLAALAELLNREAPLAPIVPAVAECLNDSSDEARTLAVLVLERAGAAAIHAIASALNEKQPISMRVLAASTLSRADGDTTSAINPLCACFLSEDRTLRWHAAFALGRIGAPAVPALHAMLRSANPETLCEVADALGWIGSAAQESLDELRRLASSSAPLSLRLACHSAVVKISGDPAAGLPMLLPTLKEKDPSVRVAALERIGELRAMAREAAPDVLACLRDPSAEVRAAAALALARIEANTPETIETLTRLLADSEPNVRANAAIALSSMGEAAAPASTALRMMRRSTQPRLAAIARAAVERILQSVPTVK
jgi:HEAT repeat protein